MVYVLLFTCAATRAVALETTTSLTVVELVQAIRRFAAQFGMPQCLVSDNASNFQAGQTLLTELMQQPVIDGFKRAHNLTWKFITPRAPWQGGFYERLIRFNELDLRKATYRCHPTYDEFVTLVQKVECLVNDRPLTYLDADDPTDTPLTTSHLLSGRTLSLAPQVHLADLTDPAFREGDILRNDYQKPTNMLQTFLKRWKYD
ncbi:uncharacterized protein [Palaemon carinicauda]|uniref:uncharacterized protein n=1 Tax=Palaemon carinicauda TaxID=392227 RepID=UPI0035B66D71